jgi:hypothetical protein
VTTSDGDQQGPTKSRLLTEARVSGNWAVGKWQLMPAAAITYVDDNAGSLEPFAFFKTSLDLDSVMVLRDAARNTIGGGVALNQPDGYSIQATANFSETLGAALPDPTLAGKVSVSMPLQ